MIETHNDEKAESAAVEENNHPTYEQLCAIYGVPGKRKFNKYEVIFSLTAFFAMLLMFFLTVFCYSRPVIIFGGNKIYGKTVNCFSFANTELNRISDFFKALDNADAENAIGIYGIIQDVFAFGMTVIILTIQTIFIIYGIVKLAKRQTDKVIKLLLRSVICNGHIYLITGYLCNTSGGVGESYFYVGNVAGIGMNVGTLFALCTAVLCLVFSTISKKKKIKEERLVKQVILNYLNFGFCVLSACVLTQIPLSRAFLYSANIGSVISAIIVNSFSFSSLLFTLLNSLIIYLPVTAFNICSSHILSIPDAILNPTNKAQETKVKAVKKRKNKKAVKPYVCTVLYFICILSVILLNIPQIGLGWSCNVLPYFAGLLILSLIWCTVYIVFTNIYLKQKNSA